MSTLNFSENANLTPEVKRIFAASRAMLENLTTDRRQSLPDYVGSVEFAQIFPEFHKDLCAQIAPDAMAAIDRVSRNVFWFLTMVGSTLAVAQTSPATADDVRKALVMQRRMAAPDKRTEQLLAKAKNLKQLIKKISKTELLEARERCFILVEVEGKQEYLVPNKVYID